MPRHRIVKTFPSHRTQPLPDSVAAIAERRIAHLEPLALDEPLRNLLVSAYMQGIVDAHGAMMRDAESLTAP